MYRGQSHMFAQEGSSVRAEDAKFYLELPGAVLSPAQANLNPGKGKLQFSDGHHLV